MIMTATSPFDVLAPTYDADFTASGIGQLQRERVWHYLDPLLKEMGSALTILEVNCGTGEDALRLANMSHKVIATDASAAMIEQAKLKQANGVEFITCAFKDLPVTLAGKKFDLIFSNFGGLNCVDAAALKKLCEYLSALTTTNGKLFFVLLSDRCIWEMMYYGIRAKFGQAFRRFKKAVDFTAGDKTMPVYYYSPRKLSRTFSADFFMQQKFPVGLFIPPSYLEKKFAAPSKRLDRLNKLEYRFGHSFLARFADHYCCIFQKSTVTT
jgi:ubiquinone/menaquinone biosynthesis C-methylase UbiE